MDVNEAGNTITSVTYFRASAKDGSQEENPRSNEEKSIDSRANSVGGRRREGWAASSPFALNPSRCFSSFWPLLDRAVRIRTDPYQVRIRIRISNFCFNMKFCMRHSK